MLLSEIRGAKVLKSLESKAIRVILVNLNGTIRRESKGESNAIRHKKGATKGIMC